MLYGGVVEQHQAKAEFRTYTEPGVDVVFAGKKGFQKYQRVEVIHLLDVVEGVDIIGFSDSQLNGNAESPVFAVVKNVFGIGRQVKELKLGLYGFGRVAWAKDGIGFVILGALLVELVTAEAQEKPRAEFNAQFCPQHIGNA